MTTLAVERFLPITRFSPSGLPSLLYLLSSLWNPDLAFPAKAETMENGFVWSAHSPRL